MSIDFYKKFDQIMQSEGIKRPAFTQRCGLNLRTFETGILRGTKPKGETLAAVCQAWPEYTLWLMTDQVQPENGQTSPLLKMTADNLNSTQKAG